MAVTPGLDTVLGMETTIKQLLVGIESSPRVPVGIAIAVPMSTVNMGYDAYNLAFP